ncbi:MAG: hypothetical protein HY954_10885 [Deltaproteobacteria bacterium]|nr:hypothetical protein [Deltaproteobacteria bacterium]
MKKFWISALLILSAAVFHAPCEGAMVLNGNTGSVKKSFYFCTDAESFAIQPTDFTRLTDMNGEGVQFAEVLYGLGNPVLRLASMQRWDWRSEEASLALVQSSFRTKPLKALGYNYMTAKQYYDFAKANGVASIPMLDVRYFYDANDKTVKDTADNLSQAAAQYAAGYAEFIKKGGYKVLFWELGNEDYSESLHFSPEKYAKVVKAFIDAVLKVDPKAKFCIQINIWDGKSRSWTDRALSGLKGYERHIDYAAVHYYNQVDFTDRITDEIVTYLRGKGFFKTRLAITEWRHSGDPDEYDRKFKSAAVYARYLLYMVKHRDIEYSCVHSLPVFGGLAEWSDGAFWTGYSEELGAIGIPDTAKTSRWRVLPFGLAQKMIIDALEGRSLIDYSENPGKTSAYLFSGSSGRSMVIINEGAAESTGSVKLDNVPDITQITGVELLSSDVEAKPSDTEPQPWSVEKMYIGYLDSYSNGSSAAVSGGAVTFRLRPYAVVKIDLN